MGEPTSLPDNGRTPFWKLALAPVLAAILTGALYWTRVDGIFYFLHGAEGQGLLLAKALSKGLGFIDLALPGNPAHVREPPLFYALMALIVRLAGLKLYPLKIFMWLSYVAGAALSAAFFQRRSNPALALVAALVCFFTPELFRFFTGPKSDILFMALCISSLLVGEILIDRMENEPEKLSKRTYVIGAACIVLVCAAVFTRSLGLALSIGLFGAMLFPWRKGAGARTRLLRAMAVLLPVAMAVGFWSARTAGQEDPASYTYVDWFMMDLKPDSPEMIAIDFHAPLAPRIPRTDVGTVIHRSIAHGRDYLGIAARQVFAVSAVDSVGSFRQQAPFLGLLLLGLIGLIRSEWKRPPLVPLFMASYFAVAAVWPMNDPRLLFPLMPFVAYYALSGGEGVVAYVATKTRLLGEKKAGYLALGLVLIAAALQLYREAGFDLAYRAWTERAPTTMTARPGFEFRFLGGKTTYDSYLLLAWAGEHASDEQVVMYHSPPPCRLITGRTCRSIPFSDNLKDVRDYIVDGGADLIVIDEWGRQFPTGPGWFVENVLRPVEAAYPADFEEVYRIPGTESYVLAVKHEDSP